MLPKIIDNDRDEIIAELDGKEIRGWSYKDGDERRVKMQKAREFIEGYDQGRRALLNALLALNPELGQKLAKVSGYELDPADDGKLPFDAVFWITGVADQLKIEPRKL